MTKRKQNFKTTNEISEEIYRVIVENSNDLIAVINFSLQPRYLYASPSHEIVLGYKSVDLLGKKIIDFIHPDDRWIPINLLKKYLANKTRLIRGIGESKDHDKLEVRFKDKKGNWRYLQSTVDTIDGQVIIISRDVTEQRKKDLALMQASREWEDTFDTMSDGISIHDKDFNVLNINEAMCQLFNINKRAIIGQKCFKVFHSLQAPIKECPLNKAQQSKQKESIEYFEKKINKWLSITVFPIEESGKVVKYIHVVRDVTSRRKAQEKKEKQNQELTASKINLEKRHLQMEVLKSLGDKLTSSLDLEEAVQLAYEHLKKIITPDVITALIANPDEEGDLYFKSFLTSSVNERVVTKAKEDMIAYLKKNKQRFKNSNSEILTKISPSLAGKKMDNTIEYVVNKTVLVPLHTGDDFYGLLHVSYCHQEKENIAMEDDLLKAMAATLSITIARLYALDRSQHSKTESLIRSLRDGIIMFSKDKNIVLTNHRATVYTGLLYASSSLSDFIKLFPNENIGEKIVKTIDKGENSYIKEVLLFKKYYEISISPVKDSEGEIVGGAIIIHDITYIKEIDRMKTEFVSVASHQLRTPLTAIKLFTEMLVNQEVGKLNKEQKEYLDNVYNSTERMVILVNDLLNVTRIESGRLRVSPQLVEVNNFVKDVIIEASATAKMKGVSIKLKKTKLPAVLLDQNLFRQVVQNMISNAVRYSPLKNGVVEVEVKQSKSDFIISVKDNGIGIPKNMQDRIFEKFFRADNAIKKVTEGTGLGLYVSKMIVENSGGSVWFDSQENQGTTFYVKMPLSGMRAIAGERGLAIS